MQGPPENFAFGTGAWTIEFWIYPNDVTTTQVVYDGRPISTQNNTPQLILSGGYITYYVAGSDTPARVALTTGSWQHVAFTRSGVDVRAFLNGTLGSSWNGDTVNYVSTQGRPVIGAGGFTNLTGSLNGYLSNFRVTKGIARYTSNFTAPTAAFPLL